MQLNLKYTIVKFQLTTSMLWNRNWPPKIIITIGFPFPHLLTVWVSYYKVVAVVVDLHHRPTFLIPSAPLSQSLNNFLPILRSQKATRKIIVKVDSRKSWLQQLINKLSFKIYLMLAIFQLIENFLTASKKHFESCH